MIVNGEKLKHLEVFSKRMTVPDCFVLGSNKLGQGHGEAKFYISSKVEMRDFYGGEKFKAKCFMLRSDLLAYMQAVKMEYLEPTQDYAGKDKFPQLWNERISMINDLDEVIFFEIYDHYSIEGPRGYVNSNDDGYRLIRELALPLISFISVEKVGDERSPLFYWKLYVDFDFLRDRQIEPLVFTYGKKKDNNASENRDAKEKEEARVRENQKARKGQEKYREELLKQCRFCPITKIAEERLLIASHIKPWAVSTKQERIDPYNGYMFSPMIDKLFDKGFITFTENRRIILSNHLSAYTWKLIGLKNNTFYDELPMDDKRIKYLQFHHSSVFLGSYDEP